jgi:hypothetical protein
MALLTMAAVAVERQHHRYPVPGSNRTVPPHAPRRAA